MTVRVGDNVVVQQNMISRHRQVYAVGQNILVKRERGGTWHTVGIIGGRLNENVICHNVGGEWIAVRNVEFRLVRLVLEYLFNEGSGTILHDTSGFGHHANIVGTDWNWHHDAIHGWTVNFHGRYSHIFVGRPIHLNMDSRSFVIEIVVRYTATDIDWYMGFLGRVVTPFVYNEFLANLNVAPWRSDMSFKGARFDHPADFRVLDVWRTHRITVNALTNRVSYHIDGIPLGEKSFNPLILIDGGNLVFGIIHPNLLDISGQRYRSMIGQIAQIRMWSEI